MARRLLTVSRILLSAFCLSLVCYGGAAGAADELSDEALAAQFFSFNPQEQTVDGHIAYSSLVAASLDFDKTVETLTHWPPPKLEALTDLLFSDDKDILKYSRDFANRSEKFKENSISFWILLKELVKIEQAAPAAGAARAGELARGLNSPEGVVAADPDVTEREAKVRKIESKSGLIEKWAEEDRQRAAHERWLSGEIRSTIDQIGGLFIFLSAFIVILGVIIIIIYNILQKRKTAKTKQSISCEGSNHLAQSTQIFIENQEDSTKNKWYRNIDLTSGNSTKILILIFLGLALLGIMASILGAAVDPSRSNPLLFACFIGIISAGFFFCYSIVILGGFAIGSCVIKYLSGRKISRTTAFNITMAQYLLWAAAVVPLSIFAAAVVRYLSE